VIIHGPYMEYVDDVSGAFKYYIAEEYLSYLSLKTGMQIGNADVWADKDF
jgi:hypothetical protein